MLLVYHNKLVDCSAHGGIYSVAVVPARVAVVYVEQNHYFGFATFVLHVGEVVYLVLLQRLIGGNYVEFSNNWISAERGVL